MHVIQHNRSKFVPFIISAHMRGSMHKIEVRIGVIAISLFISLLAQAQQTATKVVYSLTSNGQPIENQQLVLIHQGNISSVQYNDDTPDRFIDFENQTIVKTLISKSDTVKVSTPWSELETGNPETETDTILGYPCKKARLSLYSNQIEVWFTDSLGMIGSPYTSVMPHQGLVLKVVRNGNFEIKATAIEPISNSGQFFPLASVKEVTEAEFNALQIKSRYTSIPIFHHEKVNFGDSIVNPEGELLNHTYRYSKGTVILKKVALPKTGNNQVFVDLSVRSDGDAYDRTGSVFLLTDTSKMLKALRFGLDQLPVYVVNDSLQYQGVVANESYVPPLELMRFFTSFGVGHFNDKVNIEGYQWSDSCVYRQEVTPLMGDLPDEVWVGVFIGNYARNGHEVSLRLNYYPGEESKTAGSWTYPIFNTLNIMEMSDQKYATMFLYDSLEVTVDIPENLNNLQLYFTTTGHGGWENGDEFVPKVNEIFMDDSLIFHHIPWRSDCATYRLMNPASGNFGNGLSSSDLSRSNWCPGTPTPPFVIPLGELKAGKHTFKVAIPMGQPEGGSFSAWNVSGVLVGEIKKD